MEESTVGGTTALSEADASWTLSEFSDGSVSEYPRSNAEKKKPKAGSAGLFNGIEKFIQNEINDMISSDDDESEASQSSVGAVSSCESSVTGMQRINSVEYSVARAASLAKSTIVNGKTQVRSRLAPFLDTPKPPVHPKSAKKPPPAPAATQAITFHRQVNSEEPIQANFGWKGKYNVQLMSEGMQPEHRNLDRARASFESSKSMLDENSGEEEDDEEEDAEIEFDQAEEEIETPRLSLWNIGLWEQFSPFAQADEIEKPAKSPPKSVKSHVTEKEFFQDSVRKVKGIVDNESENIELMTVASPKASINSALEEADSREAVVEAPMERTVLPNFEKESRRSILRRNLNPAKLIKTSTRLMTRGRKPWRSNSPKSRVVRSFSVIESPRKPDSSVEVSQLVSPAVFEARALKISGQTKVEVERNQSQVKTPGRRRTTSEEQNIHLYDSEGNSLSSASPTTLVSKDSKQNQRSEDGILAAASSRTPKHANCKVRTFSQVGDDIEKATSDDASRRSSASKKSTKRSESSVASSTKSAGSKSRTPKLESVKECYSITESEAPGPNTTTVTNTDDSRCLKDEIISNDMKVSSIAKAETVPELASKLSRSTSQTTASNSSGENSLSEAEDPIGEAKQLAEDIKLVAKLDKRRNELTEEEREDLSERVKTIEESLKSLMAADGILKQKLRKEAKRRKRKARKPRKARLTITSLSSSFSDMFSCVCQKS